MARLVVSPARGPLTGSVPVPSDKSIGHRALIFAAIAGGASQIRRFSYGEDNLRTLAAFRAMGVVISDDGAGTLGVQGVGLSGLRAPEGDLDCGNSGTSMRVLAGLLAGQPFRSRLVGDSSLSARPMGRVVEPLRARGAVIEGTPHAGHSGQVTAPLTIGPLSPGLRLAPIEIALPIASAQVKSALLISGLYASGPTVVSEPLVSRDHTERMLDALGIPIETVGPVVKVHPPRDADAIRGFAIDLPGDLSAAAFVLAAGLIVPGSAVTTRETGQNPTRAGFLDIVRQLGANVGTTPRGDALGEPLGDVSVAHAPLSAARVGSELALRAIDEIPIVAALAARARGTSEFFDLAELRLKESDRIRAIVDMLTAFGVETDEREDGFSLRGRPDAPLSAATVSSRGDHRIAMAAAVLALVADGPSVIEDVDCIATSFPRFAGTLRALGAQIEVEP
jgi:3-phosphoshikimate 1-carboxyvinyltransferase